MDKIGYFSGSDVRNNVLSFLDRNLLRLPHLEVLRWVRSNTLKNWSHRLGDTLTHETIGIEKFNESIAKAAGGFKELGLGRGDRVILFVPMSVELYMSMFALQKIGAIPVFLDSWARRQHLGVSAKIVSPKAMVSFDKAFELCSEVPELVQVPIKVCVGASVASSQNKFSAYLEELLNSKKEVETQAVEQEETALITFTTGSSGTPKGADRTHRFLAAQHYALNACLPYELSDVDLPVFPIFLLNNLASGVSTVIPAFDIGVPSEKDDLILYTQLLSCGVSCTTLSPSLFNRLSLFCLKNDIRLNGIRRAVTGGAPVSKDDLLNFKSIAPTAKIEVLFGSTEVEPMAHSEAMDVINQSHSEQDPEWVEEGVNVGRLDPGLRSKFIKIQKEAVLLQGKLDWESLEVPKGEVGELIVAGEHVCRNYYNDLEAFKRAKIRDENGVVWHRSGDLGRLDSSSNLWIVGRVHNAISRNGRYEFPVRAEIVLKKLSQIKLAAYLGVSDPVLGEKAVCVVVPQDSGDETLKSEISRIMEKNKIPVDQIILRDHIPMDPRHHSKVEYDLLRNELRNAGLL